MRKTLTAIAVAAIAIIRTPLDAQQAPQAQSAQRTETSLRPAPNRRADEGKGPCKLMVIRGAMLIDGTGGPPRGPVDIVVEGNRIKSVSNAGTPGLPLRPARAPQNADFELDATAPRYRSVRPSPARESCRQSCVRILRGGGSGCARPAS